MNPATTLAIDSEPHAEQTATSRQIRGSSLLLVGRLLAIGLNFFVQVLVVRYLSKGDYGAFAYVLSVVSLGSTVALFGLDKSAGIFVATYHEQRDYNRMFGTIVMMMITMLSLGAAIVLIVYGLGGFIGQSLVNDQQSPRLLLILIVLAPVQALDGLLVSLFAIFASPRAIFIRRYLLAPGLQLCVVVLLMLKQSDVRFLAIGYLGAGVLGVAICALTFLRVLRNQGLFQWFNLRAIKMPARAVFGFTIPLLVTDVVFLLRSSLAVVMLEHFCGAIDVATFRAVLPVAGLNLIVFQSFKFLFAPLASRMYVRNDREGISHLYWQSAIWIAVISFPIFAATFSLARPMTILLYGTRYEESAVVLALLALGHYFNAALGFNGLTLRIFGRVRYIVTVDLLVASFSIGINLFLIPRYGALGAAISTCGTLVIQNILYQAGLRLGTGIRLFEWCWIRVYLVIALGASGLLLIQLAAYPYTYTCFALAGLVSLLVVRINGKSLNMAQTFPELLRLPLARRLFSQS